MTLGKFWSTADGPRQIFGTPTLVLRDSGQKKCLNEIAETFNGFRPYMFGLGGYAKGLGHSRSDFRRRFSN